MNYRVYNYDTQKWEDDKAKLISQLNEELKSLSDSNYIRFAGLTPEQALRAADNINSQLSDLNN